MRYKLLVAIVGAVASGAFCRAETFKLEYGPKPDKGVFSGQTVLTADKEKPEGVKAEPKYSGTPLYAGFEYGPNGKEKPILFALDKSEARAASYDVAYVDYDRDGDLREEKPLKVQGETDLRLPVPAGGKLVERLFLIRLMPFMAGGARVAIKDMGTWTGKFEFAGRTMDVMLMDVNVNGIYNDALEYVAGADRPDFRDVFTSKKSKGPLPDYTGLHFCPAVIEGGGKLYDASVAPDGSSITFEPTSGPFGCVKTAADGVTCILITEKGRCLTGATRKHKLDVPVGDAHLLGYFAEKTDRQGVEWMLMGQGEFKKTLDIQAGNEVSIVAGPPMRVSVKADKEGPVKAGSTVKISSSLSDRSGKTVQIRPLGDDKPADPEMYILIKQGEKTILKDKLRPG